MKLAERYLLYCPISLIHINGDFRNKVLPSVSGIKQKTYKELVMFCGFKKLWLNLNNNNVS